MKTLLIIWIALFFHPLFVTAQLNWQKMETVEDVCAAFPGRMEDMLHAFDLSLPGLEKVKLAFDDREIVPACKFLLDYYKDGNSAQYLRSDQPGISRKTTSYADSLIRDIFTFQLVTGKVPRSADGHLNWAYNGPENDVEWAWALNRHHPARDLLQAYFETGNPKYAKNIDSFIKDWIIESLPYPGVKSRTAVWRGLEVSFRVKVWAQVFYGLINTGYLSPATQLLILSSLPEHAHYAKNFHAQNNWLTMEISGLATVATAWKEFKDAPEWLEYSKAVMTESMKKQVYPDGVQTELTSSYHYVALVNFVLFDRICKNANEPLPEFFNRTMEDMYSYLAYTMRPDGFGILNNDADRKDNRLWIFQALENYDRDDWRYIATNGEEGTRPEKGPSVIYPWAGHLISRSGYNPDAQWSFFDIGPWGSGHQHNDKLHISISAFGRDLLVDAGRFAYRGEVAKKFRGYAKGSQGHNVILIDGKGQAPGPKLANEPLSEDHYRITDAFDYAWNSFDKFNDLEGAVKHTRALFYVRSGFWIVVDNIQTDRPRKIATMWHWHPDCKVTTGRKKIISSENEKGNLRIIPVGKSNWNIKLIKGQEKPEIQGWYSEEYNKYEPNVAAIYSTKIKSDRTFVWLLIPFEVSAPDIRAKIISENADGIVLGITDAKRDEWTCTVPYSESGKAGMHFIQKSK